MRDRLAEKVRDTEQLRESVREKERKRVMRVLGSARVLELGFSKITMFPLKNVKINKIGLFHVPVRYSIIGRYLSVRGQYGQYFSRYEIGGSTVSDCWPVRYILAGTAGTVRN